MKSQLHTKLRLFIIHLFYCAQVLQLLVYTCLLIILGKNLLSVNFCVDGEGTLHIKMSAFQWNCAFFCKKKIPQPHLFNSEKVCRIYALKFFISNSWCDISNRKKEKTSRKWQFIVICLKSRAVDNEKKNGKWTCLF